MYAIIKTGGKQYRVQEGDSIFVEKLNADVDSNVVFDQVLAVVNDGDVKVGTPVVEGAKVSRLFRAIVWGRSFTWRLTGNMPDTLLFPTS